MSPEKMLNVRRTRVYVAGPYSLPDPVVNTADAIKWGDRLWELGYTPLIPHLCHFWHLLRHGDYEKWMDYGRELLKTCDVLFRFGGESPGAEREIMDAKEMGIPVYYNILELQENTNKCITLGIDACQTTSK